MPSTTKKITCCVIGAGISGLTCAVELLKRRFSVTITSDAEGKNTTSAAAAAFWYPFWTGSLPDHSWYRPVWAWNSFLALEEFTLEPESGVSRTRLLEYFDSEMSEADVQSTIDSMWWQFMPRLNFGRLSQHDVSNLSCFGRRFQSGIAFDTLVVNMSHYLPFLRAWVGRLGGQFVTAHVSFSDLDSLLRKFDYVINCSGLGSREVIRDNAIKPIEGVVARLRPIVGVNKIQLAHTGPIFSSQPIYIVPRGGPEPDIVVGGTINENNEGEPRILEWESLLGESDNIQSDVSTIVDLCESLEPLLSSREEIGFSVGYRPSRRPGVRLEPEVELPEARGRLFHNYGHGGGGVTLSWGCAREVANWLEGSTSLRYP